MLLIDILLAFVAVHSLQCNECTATDSCLVWRRSRDDRQLIDKGGVNGRAANSDQS
jgi:hypothetical protein